MSTRRIVAALVALSGVVACTGDDDASTSATSGPGTTSPTTSPATTDAAGPATTAPESTTAPEPEALYSATIRRTGDHVPHISGETLADVGYGYGYAIAEDHLCTIADIAVQVRSEAARWFGSGDDDRWLDQDLVYRALELREESAAEFDAADADLQDMVRGYAAGYNRYLDETGVDDLPGYCSGEEWVGPIDEYDLAAYFKVLAWRASIDPLLGYIAAAEPPSGAGDNAPPTTPAGFANVLPEPSSLGSNAWAIGPTRTEDATTMIVGNPHFPWQGALRFYEVHLTVPGELDVYGASLIGSPAVNIGFNEDVAWSHTVSAGNRFTAYTLELVPGEPTTYRYGDEQRAMESRAVSADVLAADGTTSTVERTFWFSHYGPMLSIPGLEWNETTAFTMRDANADNDELIPQFFAMNTATSMDEFIDAHATHQGIPWVNTLAASADGRIWYADTAATPNLSDAAIAAWQDRLAGDPITGIAYDNGIVLLDGSDPLFEWVDAPGARDPGVVPFDEMPQLERDDVLFNANDSYWVPSLDEQLTGYSPLHGSETRPLSNRTRMNARQLAADTGDAGADGLFSLDELGASALSNRVFTAELLVDDVVARCDAAAATDEGLRATCDVLRDWDRRVDLDSVGAALWRELIGSYDGEHLTDAGPLWAEPFSTADPLGTPSGFGDDPELIDRLVAAADQLRAAGFDITTPLGEIQFADRGGTRVPIHGGTGATGVTNVVGAGSNSTTSEEGASRGAPIEGSRSLTADGYPIMNGTSFVYHLEFTDAGPTARALLTYGETGDTDSPLFSSQTERFSAKDWRTIAFHDDDISADPDLAEVTISE